MLGAEPKLGLVRARRSHYGVESQLAKLQIAQRRKTRQHRRIDGTEKIRFSSQQEAQAEIEQTMAKLRRYNVARQPILSAYPCWECSGWHIGRKIGSRHQRLVWKHDSFIELGERVTGCMSVENAGRVQQRLEQIRRRIVAAQRRR